MWSRTIIIVVLSCVTIMASAYPQAESLDEACPGGWTERPGTGICYFVSTKKAVWLKARDACSDLKSSLVSIHSDSENRFIHSLLNKTRDYWIGMTADSLRNAKWYDGSDVTWTKWFEPPTPYFAWCACLFSSISFSDGSWGAVVCHVDNPYVCKKDLYAHSMEKGKTTYPWLPIVAVAVGAIVLIVVVIAAKTNAIHVAKRQFQSTPSQRPSRINRSDMPLPPIPNAQAMSLPPPLHANRTPTVMFAHSQTGSAELSGNRFQHGFADTSFTSEDGYEIPRRLPQGCSCPTYLEILPSILDHSVDFPKDENNEDDLTMKYGSVTL